jgi:hypothetical protein
MIWSHVRNGALAAVVLTATLPVAAAAAPFNYTFDADAQGWTSVGSGPGHTLTYSPTGGNPEGFIAVGRFTNTGSGTGTLTPLIGVSRAVAFDAADYGGTVSFDAKLVSKDSAVYDAALSTLGLSGSANGLPFDFSLELSSPLTSPFGTSSFTLGTAANWSFRRLMDLGSPRTATEADFLAFLPLVTNLTVMTSFKIDRGTNGAVSVGFDNISLTAPTPEPTPVPEPATLTLLGVGLASVVARRYRR